MSGHKRIHTRSRRSAASGQTASGGQRAVFPFGRLIVACVSIGAVVILAVAYFRLPSGPDSEPLDALPPVRLYSPQATIELPAAPAEATADTLRPELESVGEKLLATYPNAPEALHVVALLDVDLQKPADARQLWQKCIQSAPRDPGPYVGLAQAAMQLGQDEAAVATLQQALAAGCSTPEIYHELAAALTKLGQLEKAAALAEEGLRKFPRSAENWLQLGQTQLELDRFAAAETSLLAAIAEGNQSDAALFALATAMTRQGKEEAAAKYRDEFTRRKAAQQNADPVPFQTRYEGEFRRIAVATLCRAGAVFGHQGDPAEAERLYLRAYHLDPTSSAACGELVRIYRSRDRIADARLVQRRLVELEPHDVFQQINYASLSAQVGDTSAAEATLQRAIGLRPELAIGYLALAQLYLQQGNDTQARWFAEAAQRQQLSGPDEAVQACLVLAAACHKLGDHAAAQAALAKARTLAPHDPRLPPATATPPASSQVAQ